MKIAILITTIFMIPLSTFALSIGPESPEVSRCREIVSNLNYEDTADTGCFLSREGLEVCPKPIIYKPAPSERYYCKRMIKATEAKRFAASAAWDFKNKNQQFGMECADPNDTKCIAKMKYLDEYDSAMLEVAEAMPFCLPRFYSLDDPGFDVPGSGGLLETQVIAAQAAQESLQMSPSEGSLQPEICIVNSAAQDAMDNVAIEYFGPDSKGKHLFDDSYAANACNMYQSDFQDSVPLPRPVLPGRTPAGAAFDGK